MVLAAGVVVACPLLATYAWRVKPYTVDALLAAVVLGLAARVLDRPADRGRWATFGIASLAALAMSAATAMTSAGCAVVLLVVARQHLRHLVPVVVPVAVAALAWWAAIVRPASTDALRDYWSDQLTITTAFEAARSLLPFDGVGPMVLLAVSAVGVALAARPARAAARRRPRRRRARRCRGSGAARRGTDRPPPAAVGRALHGHRRRPGAGLHGVGGRPRARRCWPRPSSRTRRRMSARSSPSSSATRRWTTGSSCTPRRAGRTPWRPPPASTSTVTAVPRTASTSCRATTRVTVLDPGGETPIDGAPTTCGSSSATAATTSPASAPTSPAPVTRSTETLDEIGRRPHQVAS